MINMATTIEKKIRCYACGKDNLVTIGKDTEWFTCSYCGVENEIQFETQEEIKAEILNLIRQKLEKLEVETDKRLAETEPTLLETMEQKNHRIIASILLQFADSGKDKQLVMLKRNSDGSIDAYFVVEAEPKEYKRVE